jgi:uncharacterized protein (DUF305 family)
MKHEHAQHAEPNHYRHLAIMAGVSFIAMYILMYAMVDVLGNVLNNLNQVYMAGLMTAPMVLIEMAVMRGMYTDRRRNTWIAAAAVAALIGFFVLIRQQAAITDRQFLRSMIPHHASAILMCTKAPIEDPQIKDLCDGIIAGQQAEINQMKEMLGE